MTTKNTVMKDALNKATSTEVQGTPVMSTVEMMSSINYLSLEVASLKAERDEMVKEIEGLAGPINEAFSETALNIKESLRSYNIAINIYEQVRGLTKEDRKVVIKACIEAVKVPKDLKKNVKKKVLDLCLINSSLKVVAEKTLENKRNGVRTTAFPFWGSQ